jgi:5-oxoprolinase (ATP-hydrolysing)
MQPGDVYMLNAPYNGGTHLPDITVITPVFAPASSEILFYVASRGHHEDIGGLTPGSMTPKATHIDEEGVYIDNFKLVDRGRFLEAETHALLSGAKYPARRPDKNIADLKAHVAANAKGMTELDKMVRHFGLDVVKAYMGHVQDNAEESVRRLLSRLKDGHFRRDGSGHARVKITSISQPLGVDFTAPHRAVAASTRPPRHPRRRSRLRMCRADPDECRLHEPSRGSQAPAARLSGGRRRRTSRPARSSPTACSRP